MIEVKIGDKIYTIPDELPIEDWIKINKLGLENDFNWAKIIAIIFKADLKILEETDIETLRLIIGFLAPLINKRTESKVIDFEKMSFGNFVDLEVYLSLNYTNHIKEMMDILSPYSKTASKALYVIERWMEWRNHIYKQYKGLFENEDSDDDERVIKAVNKLEIAKSWYKVIVDLANDDILKMEEIENQPFRKVLNFMSYRKGQAKLMELEMKKRQRQYELQKRGR